MTHAGRGTWVDADERESQWSQDGQRLVAYCGTSGKHGGVICEPHPIWQVMQRVVVKAERHADTWKGVVTVVGSRNTETPHDYPEVIEFVVNDVYLRGPRLVSISARHESSDTEINVTLRGKPAEFRVVESRINNLLATWIPPRREFSLHCGMANGATCIRTGR